MVSVKTVGLPLLKCTFQVPGCNLKRSKTLLAQDIGCFTPFLQISGFSVKISHGRFFRYPLYIVIHCHSIIRRYILLVPATSLNAQRRNRWKKYTRWNLDGILESSCSLQARKHFFFYCVVRCHRTYSRSGKLFSGIFCCDVNINLNFFILFIHNF
jgi:hypothetical protein